MTAKRVMKPSSKTVASADKVKTLKLRISVIQTESSAVETRLAMVNPTST